MEDHEKSLSRYALVPGMLLVIGVLALVGWGGCSAMNGKPQMPPALQQVLKKMEAGTSPATQEILQLQRDPGVILALGERLSELPNAMRAPALRLLADLGRPAVQRATDLSPSPAPYIGDSRVVAYLVGHLADESVGLRNLACTLLVESVPDALIRNHSAEIVDKLRKFPMTDSAPLLLGKTGAEAALRLLESEVALREMEPGALRAARARLGDLAAERELISTYTAAHEPRERAALAMWLGYLASPHAVLTLARDVRTPESYVWQQRSRRSMRVHLIQALHRAYPSEPVFWPPVFKPSDDSYYESIESWLTQNLGVSWPDPRPEFLYEEDAPIPPPRGDGPDGP